MLFSRQLLIINLHHYLDLDKLLGDGLALRSVSGFLELRLLMARVSGGGGVPAAWVAALGLFRCETGLGEAIRFFGIVDLFLNLVTAQR